VTNACVIVKNRGLTITCFSVATFY